MKSATLAFVFSVAIGFAAEEAMASLSWGAFAAVAALMVSILVRNVVTAIESPKK